MLPPGFDIDEMEVNSFDVEAVREGSKKTIPKLKLKLTWTFIYIVDYLNNCSSLGMYSLIISSTSLTHTKNIHAFVFSPIKTWLHCLTTHKTINNNKNLKDVNSIPAFIKL